MAAKKRGLGKGLEALLGESAKQLGSSRQQDGGIVVDGELHTIPIDLMQRGKYQPRSAMDPDSLEELADSIRAQGVIQPIVVRQLATDPGRYEIIAGERRWRAAQIAGLHEIAAVVRDVPDQAAVAMALIENIQREELNPMEEANALQRLIDEFGLTHQETADAVGRSRTAVTNLLRLLGLGDDVKRLLESGDLEMGHARALLALDGAVQGTAARRVAEKGMSVRETERMVKQIQQPPKEPIEKRIDPDIAKLERDLAEKLGARVALQHGTSGSGKVLISYNSLDELDGILEHIK